MSYNSRSGGRPRKPGAKIRKPVLGAVAALLCGGLSFLGAQEAVNTAELEVGRSASVIFINYDGPPVRVETLEQIRSIGFSPGTLVRNGAARSGESNRYFVIHSVSGPEGTRLDADIFGLGVDAGVDHINNLRLIIQGYLEGAYAYAPRDAALLAEYITIYNAVFRGNWGYFSTRYKGPVVQHLTSEKAGISIRFDQWPGQTLMLVPLALGRAGTLSAVDTSSLSSPRVVEEMRNQEDLGIERRRDMVDLMERESEEAEQRAVIQREQIAREEQRITQERAETAAEREQIAREREAAQTAAASGQATPAETQQAEEALAEREAAAAEREEALDQREETLAEQREEAERTEEFAEQKAEEAQEQRQEIARDQQSVIVREQEQQPPTPAGIIGVRITGTENSLGRVVKVDADNGAELRSSGLSTVNARSLTQVGGRFLMLAGETREGQSITRLVEINPDTLEITRQGEDDIHPQSLIWVYNDKLYAIAGSGSSFYLTRFNANLAREAQSSIPVHPYGSPNFQGDTILIQRGDGSVAILNTTNLTEKR
jgi:hypothetical protein